MIRGKRSAQRRDWLIWPWITTASANHRTPALDLPRADVATAVMENQLDFLKNFSFHFVVLLT